MASSLPYRSCRYRTRFTVDIDHFVNNFKQEHRHHGTPETPPGHGSVLNSNSCAQWIKKQSIQRISTIEEKDGCVAPMGFKLAYYHLNRYTWDLKVFINCSQGYPRLVGVHNFVSDVWAIFLSSHDDKQRGK